MKVTQNDDRIVISLKPKEAYRFFNFIEYASREGLDWTYGHSTGQRWLQHEDESSPTGGPALGLKLARRIADAIDSFVASRGE